MQHRFDTDIASRYDIVTAIILDNLYFWIEKNRINDYNFRDGRYWTYNTKKAMVEWFPYLNERQLDYALKKMVDEGLIIKGNYNENKYDRTLWYAISDFGYSILQNCKMYNVYTITSTNTVCNTDIKENTKRKTTIANEFDEEFEKVWAMYPRKVNKKLAKTAYIKSRKEGVSFETIRKGVEIYAESCKVNNTPECYIAHGSTWFNGHRWEDVYDENEPLDDMKGLNLGIML
jgi:hypothetical protein